MNLIMFFMFFSLSIGVLFEYNSNIILKQNLKNNNEYKFNVYMLSFFFALLAILSLKGF